MATQLLGGALADKYGGKVVMAAGIAWFSVASLLLPAAISAPVVAAGLTVPAILLARCLVVSGGGSSFCPQTAGCRQPDQTPRGLCTVCLCPCLMYPRSVCNTQTLSTHMVSPYVRFVDLVGQGKLAAFNSLLPLHHLDPGGAEVTLEIGQLTGQLSRARGA